MPLSVCIISGAEAARIGRALQSVAGWAAEIIVVLNAEVTDETEQIAAKHGAKVFREPWKGHIAQKNSAARKATQEWILGLDADEAVSQELKTEIQELFGDGTSPGQFAAFSFPRLTNFCGRWIRHGDWYPDRGIRLWRRGSAEWGGVDPHDKLQVQGRVGRLRSDLLHYNALEIDDQLAKISAYSEDFARDALKQGQRATWADLAFRPAWRFVRAYIVRLGFLDGWQGYYIAWMTAFHSVTRYSKVRLAQGKPQRTT
ncbi:MAG TPA: glycosyltransferase family 2 protein [Verrucomicrobiae bacterium]